MTLAYGFGGLSDPPLFVSHPQALQQIFTDNKRFKAPGELNMTLRPFFGESSVTTITVVEIVKNMIKKG